MSNSHLIEHELMLLCQSIVADGKVDLDEIKALKKWLQRHRESDLPSVKSLADLVDRITADRKVTSSEQQELLGTLNNLLSQQTSPVEVACGGCGQRYATHATSIAQDVVCPACSTVVVVPSVGEVAANVVKPAARPSDFGQIPMNAMLAEARGRLGTKAGTTLGLGYVGIAIGIAFLLMGVFLALFLGN